MKHKKISFSILEDIEKKNVEKNKIDIKKLFFQKEKCLEQLTLLENYRNEYLQKLKHKIQLGIFLNQWENYNNFIFMLNCLIKDSRNKIKKIEEIINKNLTILLKNNTKLKTWNYLNQKNKKEKIKKSFLIEQMTTDKLSQFRSFQKGKYYNVKTS
jgi:flagellar FliJ protein